MRHVLRASAVGAVIEWACVPRSPVLQRQPMQIQQRCALTGGDDYELLFTAAPRAPRGSHRGGSGNGVASLASAPLQRPPI